jgi:hypothetical protein
LSLLRHGSEEKAEVLLGVAERHLKFAQAVVLLRRFAVGVRKILQENLILVEPVSVRVGLCVTALDLFIRYDATFPGIDEEYPSRMESLFLEHVLRRNIENAHLGRHHDEPLVGDVVA